MILIKNLSKSYTVGKKSFSALKNINLEIPQGSICGIIGGSGAGKSSLLRCINLLEEPSDGNIFFEGIDLIKLSAAELRKARSSIGMIFQHFNLLSRRTVWENIALPLEIKGISKDEINHTIPELLELIGLKDKAKHYPHQLSGGQKQRVAIARALATKPKLLLCDEATSALDPQTTGQILDLIQKINKKLGLTVILITHELDVVKKICTQVSLIDKGQIKATQSVLDFFTRPKNSVAKSYIQKNLLLDLPNTIRENFSPASSSKNKNCLIRLTFCGKLVQQPILSETIKHFDIEANILQSNTELIGDIKIGTLVVILQGDEKNISSCIKSFNEKKIEAERLGYVI